MLRLLGIGHALAEIQLPNPLLVDLCKQENSEYGWIQNRRVTLPHEYIKGTGNADPAQALAAASHSPTDLAEIAVRTALERAGLALEDIGLIIAGGATPRQTTPSEAQRVGKRLGIKVPAYDVCAVGADLALQLATISRWRTSRVPEYVLCISTSTASQRVDYSRGGESYLIGDGACACVISPSANSGLQVVEAIHTTDPASARLSSIDIYGHLKIDHSGFGEWVTTKFSKQLERHADKAKTAKVYFEHIAAGQPEAAVKIGFGEKQLISDTANDGYVVGSGAFISLSRRWNELNELSETIVVSAGVGQSFGSILLKP